ncbi:MAG: tyrosine-type recombinase/integrase [Phycisphaerales bacterium]
MAGLVHHRVSAEPMTLGDLTREFVERSTVKHGTLQVYHQAIRSLHEYFGEQHPLDSITPREASAWASDLAKSTLADATQSKRIHTVKAIFNRAVEWELFDRSPFQKIKSGSQANPDRLRYVDASIIQDVLNFCPDDEWRGVICLARFAGLRCPSEISRLTWHHVDLDRRRMLVLSSKTEHHAGKGRRTVPIIPTLYPVLARLFDERRSDANFVVPRLAGKSNANLRTQFLKFIDRSGHQKWPRIFQNLRASAETDWLEVSPPFAVAAWMGHSPQVAVKHYLGVRDRDIDEATDPKVWERAHGKHPDGWDADSADGN